MIRSFHGTGVPLRICMDTGAGADIILTTGAHRAEEVILEAAAQGDTGSAAEGWSQARVIPGLFRAAPDHSRATLDPAAVPEQSAEQLAMAAAVTEAAAMAAAALEDPVVPVREDTVAAVREDHPVAVRRALLLQDTVAVEAAVTLTGVDPVRFCSI